MKGFNILLPTAHRLVIGTIKGDLITFCIGKDAAFFVEEVIFIQVIG